MGCVCKLTEQLKPLKEGKGYHLKRSFKIVLGILDPTLAATFRYYENLKVKFIVIIKDCGSCAAEIDQGKIKQ